MAHLYEMPAAEHARYQNNIRTFLASDAALLFSAQSFLCALVGAAIPTRGNGEATRGGERRTVSSLARVGQHA